GAPARAGDGAGSDRPAEARRRRPTGPRVLVAARPHARHARLVPPFRYDPDGSGPLQPGLPGIFAEEAPLTSEVVIDGGILARRQREALAALRGLLLERPPDIPPEEWRVIVATLASPVGHLGRVPGSPAKALGAVQIAR